MSCGTSAEAAQRLLDVLDEERTRSGAPAALDAVMERLRPAFSRWIGSEDWDSLLGRARAEAAMSSPPDDVDARTLVAVADFFTRLLGPSLALQLIQQACAAPTPFPGRRAHHG